MASFYVYVDYTIDGRPFYVGKGLLCRVKLLNRRNPRHTAIRKAYGIRREVVLETIIEREALDREICLIAELKTRHGVDGNWGANFIAGGEGQAGVKPWNKGRSTPGHVIAKMRAAALGKKDTPETRAKKSQALVGRPKKRVSR